MIKFIKIQTSRAKLKELIGQFSSGRLEGELIIAPRPLPKHNFKFYSAYARIVEGSKNHTVLVKIKNQTFLTEDTFISETDIIEHYWRVPKNDPHTT